MRKVLPIIILIMTSTTSEAACSGSGNFYNCSDSSGNSYSVQRYGNQTHMQGYNFDTGSSWSQNSTSYGNTTITNGFDADGNSWNMTQQKIGNSTITSGFDSDGNYFSKTCNSYGCY